MIASGFIPGLFFFKLGDNYTSTALFQKTYDQSNFDCIDTNFFIMKNSAIFKINRTIFLLGLFYSTLLQGQNASLTLKDYNLKGNIKEVAEAVVAYDSWRKEARTRLNKTYRFDRQGFLTYIESDPEAFQGNDYIYETLYVYNNNYSEMIITSNTFNNGAQEIDKESVEVYNLIKTGIGYLQDYKASPSIKRNSKGEITDYTWYSPKSSFGNSIYTFEYKEGHIYETKTALVTSRYNTNGVKIYDYVLASPSYYYYNEDGFLYKKIYYPLAGAVYDYYEYIKDNRGNWVQKRKYTFYTGSSGKWDIKEIEYRKITYQDGVITGSNVFNQRDLDQALAKQSTLPVWTDDPRAIDNRMANQGCIKGNCQDGFGKWNYENGMYEGFFKNGKKQGMGNYQWNDGSIYIGHWNNDTMDGYGFYSAKDNPDLNHYFGYFKNGNFEGKGASDKVSKFERGIYKNGSLITAMNFYDNKIQQGCTAGDCQNGFGRFIFNNGDNFTGFFVNGVQTSGTYVFSAGGSYSGEFNVSGQFHGQGFFLDTSKTMYYGNWHNGSLNGLGLKFEETTNTYSPGIWTNGNLTQLFQF